MYVTIYKRPHGRTEDVKISNVRPEDAKWFEVNNIGISMENLEMDIAVYADCGFRVDDSPGEEVDELIEIASGRTCEDTLSALRAKCEEAIKVRPRYGKTVEALWGF